MSDPPPPTPPVLEYSAPAGKSAAGLQAVASKLCAWSFIPGVLFICAGNPFFSAPVLWLVVALPVFGLAFAIAAKATAGEKDKSGRVGADIKKGFLANGGTLLVVVILAVVLPNLGRAREQGKRVRCAGSLRDIGRALQIYAFNNKSQYPSGFDALYLDRNVNPLVFICASSDEIAASGATQQAIAAKITANPHHCSYVYTGAGLTSATVTPNHILAYEKAANHDHDGMNILFGDGHAEWMTQKQADHIIAELKAGHNPPRP